MRLAFWLKSRIENNCCPLFVMQHTKFDHTSSKQNESGCKEEEKKKNEEQTPPPRLEHMQQWLLCGHEGFNEGETKQTLGRKRN